MKSFGGFMNENNSSHYQQNQSQSQVSEASGPTIASGNLHMYKVMNDFSNSKQVIPNANIHFPHLQQATPCEQDPTALDCTSGAPNSNLWGQPYTEQTSQMAQNPFLGNSDSAMGNQRLPPQSHSGGTHPYTGSAHSSNYHPQQDMRALGSGTGGIGFENMVGSLQPPEDIYQYSESSGCPVLGWTESYNDRQWQLMGGHRMDGHSWGLPSCTAYSTATTAPTNFSFSNANKHKSVKLSSTNLTANKSQPSQTQSSSTTHEDYQQDVLIQQEFQRLDEMLLRDDDDDLSCLSDMDEVSVESVVSSEQQYDSPSPWELHEQPLATLKEDDSTPDSGSGQLSTGTRAGAPEAEFTIPTAKATILHPVATSSCPVSDPGRSSHALSLADTRPSSLSSRVAAVVEEFRQNCEQLMVHSNQCAEESHRKVPSSHSPSQTVGTTAVRTNTTTLQAMEPVPVSSRKCTTFRPTALATTSTYDIQRRVPSQAGESQPRFREQKYVGRVRAEEVRLTDRPATTVPIQGYQAFSSDVGEASPEEFSPGFLSERLTTSRLPRVRLEQQQQNKRSPNQQLNVIKNISTQSQTQNYPTQNTASNPVQCHDPVPPPQNQNIQTPTPRSSFRRKPLTVASHSARPESLAPSNMMGISHGDGVWGAVPEMNARMYLPHGVLHFKMEYQPTGSRNMPFTTQQPRSHQHQNELASNLVKFTHPIIHMLPLSSDGSTRFNVTFDVLYQN